MYVCMLPLKNKSTVQSLLSAVLQTGGSPVSEINAQVLRSLYGNFP